MDNLGRTFEDYLEIAGKFHGTEAPGALIGGFMTDLAARNLREATFPPGSTS